MSEKSRIPALNNHTDLSTHAGSTGGGGGGGGGGGVGAGDRKKGRRRTSLRVPLSQV